MLEAMASGAFVIGSATAPVEEVIEEGHNGWLVDFFDTAAMSERIAEGLARRDQVDALRRAARQTVIDRYELKACLAAAGPRMVWTRTAQGKPRSEKGFSNWISKAAGPGYSAHGLRKNRLMALAECGGSSVQLQAWCGHQSLSEVETYVREASRRAALLGNVK